MTGLPRPVIANFLRLYGQVAAGQTGEIREKDILPVTDLPVYSDLLSYKTAGEKQLAKLVILKLNGGLGTSMGLRQAKTLLPVKDGLNFLDIIVRQSGQSKLVLLNSFSTDNDTRTYLAKYPQIEFLRQNKHPKIYCDTLEPAAEIIENWNWNPPGHGDLYPVLADSGLLERWLEDGCEYLFISNSDNLGAAPDPAMLGYLAERKLPFLMEVARRTPADLKGGHLVRYPDGRLALREVAQINPEDQDAAQDIGRHKYFNTNSMWLSLRALANLLADYEQIFPLPLIRNPKPVNPEDRDSRKVYQLETAAGAAIEFFPSAAAVETPRERFVPVKKCADLLALWSDLYILTKTGCLTVNPRRALPPILIDLDEKYFSFIQDFTARVTQPPSLVDCSSLKLRGDIILGIDVVFRGRVSLFNPGQQLKLERRIFADVEARL
ncbi:MAG: UTP--glucose-1-phosphate uridylyltransferase [Candidatus Margulisbacteria bacterium]|nr:UTP--glucose-1-phosphate uridylyltransferase [Candidatus Margulisiibacteriota bacterium]